MVLCARSTSRSREQNKKRRSHSENMRKVRSFYSQNNKIVWLSGRHWTVHEVRKGIYMLIVSNSDWLGKQIPIKWKERE